MGRLVNWLSEKAAIAALEREKADYEKLRECIQINIDGFVKLALTSVAGLDEQKLVMEMLKMVWSRLKEKYHTRYKMTTDIIDLSSLLEMPQQEACQERAVSIQKEGLGKWCVKIGDSSWWISCRQGSGFQVIFISPFRNWFTRGEAGLFATYRMPEMLLEIDKWKIEIDDMLAKSIQRLRRAVAENKIQTATANAYVGTELEGCCKFHVWVTDGDVTVKAAIKGDKVVSFTFPFGEIYDKVPKIRRAVEAMNDMVEDFGVGTLPQKPDMLDSVWM